MINVRKEIVGTEQYDKCWSWTILVGDKSAGYLATGKSKIKGKEDAIKSLRRFLKGEGVECE